MDPCSRATVRWKRRTSRTFQIWSTSKMIRSCRRATSRRSWCWSTSSSPRTTIRSAESIKETLLRSSWLELSNTGQPLKWSNTEMKRTVSRPRQISYSERLKTKAKRKVWSSFWIEACRTWRTRTCARSTSPSWKRKTKRTALPKPCIHLRSRNGTWSNYRSRNATTNKRTSRRKTVKRSSEDSARVR